MLEPQIGTNLIWKLIGALVLAVGVGFLIRTLSDFPVPVCVAIAVILALFVFFVRRPFWEWLLDLMFWW